MRTSPGPTSPSPAGSTELGNLTADGGRPRGKAQADRAHIGSPTRSGQSGPDCYQYVALGRISTAPPRRAAGTREANSIAESRSSASRTRYPPTASLSPMNGPSVRTVLPSCTWTVVAVSGSPSGTPEVTPVVSLIAW